MTLAVSLLFASSASAFLTQQPPRTHTTLASVVTREETSPLPDLPTIEEKPTTTTTTATAPVSLGELRFKRYAGISTSPLIPSLPRPELLDGSHAGDYGFDPLGLISTRDELHTMMEAEIRHCRLAMLCAVGWPLSELWPAFDGALLADGGRAPSVLNGHLFNSPSIIVVLAFFAEVAYRDLKALSTPKQDTLYGHIHAQDYAQIADEWPWGVAGDLDFDPLGLYGIVANDAVGRKVMRDLEFNHGRVAMLAVLAYVLLEASTGKAVVDITPWLFANF